jgi:6-phosphogluconolactonase
LSHNWHMHIQKNQGELATAMAFVMASEAMRAKEMNVQMHIALSGGKTPLKIFQRLGFEKDLWTHVHFWWGDERMVPPDHPDSNAGHAVELFMKPAGVPASNIHRIKGELPPMQALQEYGKELEAHFGVGVMPQFDWIWLGLGVDGHTAFAIFGFLRLGR